MQMPVEGEFLCSAGGADAADMMCRSRSPNFFASVRIAALEFEQSAPADELTKPGMSFTRDISGKAAASQALITRESASKQNPAIPDEITKNAEALRAD